MFDLAEHIGNLKQKTTGEYAGACPWCGGSDRFIIWPSSGDTGRFWCRQCGESGDGIEYLRRVDGMTFPQACEAAGCPEKAENGASVTRGDDSRHTSTAAPPHPAESVTEDVTRHTSGCHTSTADERSIPEPMQCPPPSDRWQDRAWSLIDECQAALWSDTAAGESARFYLTARGFSGRTLRCKGIGLNLETRFDDPEAWGLNRDGKVWIPAGITIPWHHRGRVWGLNVRRPDGKVDPDADEAWKTRKYQRVAGSKNALFNADQLDGRPVALVEGEFDAMAIFEATDEVAAVATGSTHWGRTPRWRALLRAAPLVLVAFDSEKAGEKAAQYWTSTLDHAIRWRPHMHDAAEMLEEGADVARWIHEGVTHAAEKLG